MTIGCQFCEDRVSTRILKVKVEGGWNYYVVCNSCKKVK